MRRKGWMLGMIVLLAAAARCNGDDDKIPSIPPHPDEALFGARIPLTMTLLETSNENLKRNVKIIFYGQSIVAGSWTKIVEDELRRRYPSANLIVENRAIGGHTAPALVRCAVHDLYPFYPDLVVFHVYGGETTGELERIFSNIRRYTTAEIMTFTHHTAWPREGGEEAVTKRTKSDDLSSDMTRYLAQKYDCELVEVRKEWDEYLKHHHLEAKDFLGDTVHPNAKGGQLLAGLMLRHFRYNTLFPAGWADRVRTYEARRALEEATDEITFTGEPWKVSGNGVLGASKDSALRLEFDGNRVDVIAAAQSGELGTTTIRIDGKAPSSFPEVYVATRPSSAPQVWWPAVKRITLGKDPVAEDWKLTITEISDDGRRYKYNIVGSVTGPDGNGSDATTFMSNSGRIIIEPRDFGIASACQYKKVKCPTGYEVTWKVVAMCMDTWQPQPLEDPAIEPFYTIVQGLKNTKHVLEIIPNGDGPVPIKEIVVHRPPLR
ncbi:MAG: SGNH/GDSL hydrolase family protein [Planctomycetota bacterium]